MKMILRAEDGYIVIDLLDTDTQERSTIMHIRPHKAREVAEALFKAGCDFDQEYGA